MGNLNVFVVLLAASVWRGVVGDGVYLVDDFERGWKPSPQAGLGRNQVSPGDGWFYGSMMPSSTTYYRELGWITLPCFGDGYGTGTCNSIRQGILQPDAGIKEATAQYQFLQTFGAITLNGTVFRPATTGDGNTLRIILNGVLLHSSTIAPGGSETFQLTLTNIKYGDALMVTTGPKSTSTGDALVTSFSFVAACSEYCNCHNCLEEYLRSCPTPVPWWMQTPTPGTPTPQPTPQPTPVPGAPPTPAPTPVPPTPVPPTPIPPTPVPPTPFPPTPVPTTEVPPTPQPAKPTDECNIVDGICSIMQNNCDMVNNACENGVPGACFMAQQCVTLVNDCLSVQGLCVYDAQQCM